jgi:hypothetical protein
MSRSPGPPTDRGPDRGAPLDGMGDRGVGERRPLPWPMSRADHNADRVGRTGARR